MNCTLCKSPLLKKTEEEYYNCPVCRARVKDSSLYLTAEEEKLRYQTHNNDINDPRYRKFTSPITNVIFDNFGAQHEGLDFGSGTGPVISGVLKEAGYNVKQFDPFFANDPGLLKLQYDYIFACEVVEHFYGPAKEFEQLFTMLKPGGKLILMTHLYEDTIDFNTWYYRKDPTHVFIYCKETFEYIAAKCDFEKTEIKDRLVVLSRKPG